MIESLTSFLAGLGFALLLIMPGFLWWRLRLLHGFAHQLDEVNQRALQAQQVWQLEKQAIELTTESELGQLKQQLAQADSLQRQQTEALSLCERQRQEYHQQWQETLRQCAVVDEQNRQLRGQVEEGQGLRQQLRRMEQDQAEHLSRYAALQSEYAQQKQHADEKLELLQEARVQLQKDFENLANRIFDEKSERFSKQSQSVLDGTLNPLREQLKDFKSKVEEVYDKEARDRVGLLHEIGQLKSLNQQMSHDAVNLTRALKGDSKAQGNWGEVVLERVLEESGLRKDHEYETQFSIIDEQGQRRQPDVIVHLPERKDIIIDAKVSLVAYERYCSSGDDEVRQKALKEHIQSLRSHVLGLSQKSYEHLPGLRTLDFVLIFVPIESAFMLAVEHDQTLFRDAYEKNIILVSPTTLLATLRTVESIWRHERQNRNAEEIASQAGKLHDEFVRLLETLEVLGKHLDKSQEAYQDSIKRISSGRGNLLKRTADLEKLGAKAKKRLPDSFRDDSESALDHVELPDVRSSLADLIGTPESDLEGDEK